MGWNSFFPSTSRLCKCSTLLLATFSRGISLTPFFFSFSFRDVAKYRHNSTMVSAKSGGSLPLDDNLKSLSSESKVHESKHTQRDQETEIA